MSYFPFQGNVTDTDRLNANIAENANKQISDVKWLENEINKFRRSEKRKWMLTGAAYYEGEHDILGNTRKVIGRGGRLEVNENLPNNKRVDNQYAKLVDQKVNFQLGKPLTIETEKEVYNKRLISIMNKRFHRAMRNVGIDVMNGGVAWLYPYHDERGEFIIKRFRPWEIIPYWQDSDHTILDFALRLYDVLIYDGEREIVQEKVDVFTLYGVEHYEFINGKLYKDVTKPDITPYILIEDGENVTAANWERVPLIPIRFNSAEIPLIKRVKSLQDGINKMLSTFENNMEEDARNTILILHNYEGQDLGEFRRNLSVYGAVKVRSGDGMKGGVETLYIEVNAENYKSILSLFKKALIENGRGYDTKDERMSNNPNQMNIQSMYADIELDANGFEIELQASFEELLWFINIHLANAGLGDFEGEPVNIIFNRDILINEKEVVEVLEKSPYMSLESRLGQHPYVQDVQMELKRIERERQQYFNAMDNYETTFGEKGTNSEDIL